MATVMNLAAPRALTVFHRPQHQQQQSATAPSRPLLGLRRSLSSPAAGALSSSSSSCFAGFSLVPRLSFQGGFVNRGTLVKVRAGKPALGCTKRSRSRKSRARASGFRVRLQTPGGRNVLRRRRAKGRRVLCPASNPNSGKRA